MNMEKKYNSDWTNDADKSMTIREYYEKHKNAYDITEEPIYSFDDGEELNLFHIEEDEDGDLYFCYPNLSKKYYEDDVEIRQVVEDIEVWVKNELTKL